jgi:hypothetical protein
MCEAEEVLRRCCLPRSLPEALRDWLSWSIAAAGSDDMCVALSVVRLISTVLENMRLQKHKSEGCCCVRYPGELL